MRTDIIPKYIQLDAESLVEIFIKKDKKKYLDGLTSLKNNVWESIFQMNNRIFKQKGFSSNYCISTDGYSVSIRFIKNKYLADNNMKKEKLKQGKQNAKKIYEGLAKEEVERIRAEKKETLKKSKIKKMVEQKEEFRKLDKETKEKIIQEKKGFQCIGGLKGEELEKVKNSKRYM